MSFTQVHHWAITRATQTTSVLVSSTVALSDHRVSGQRIKTQYSYVFNHLAPDRGKDDQSGYYPVQLKKYCKSLEKRDSRFTLLSRNLTPVAG